MFFSVHFTEQNKQSRQCYSSHLGLLPSITFSLKLRCQVRIFVKLTTFLKGIFFFNLDFLILIIIMVEKVSFSFYVVYLRFKVHVRRNLTFFEKKIFPLASFSEDALSIGGNFDKQIWQIISGTLSLKPTNPSSSLLIICLFPNVKIIFIKKLLVLRWCRSFLRLLQI